LLLVNAIVIGQGILWQFSSATRWMKNRQPSAGQTALFLPLKTLDAPPPPVPAHSKKIAGRCTKEGGCASNLGELPFTDVNYLPKTVKYPPTNVLCPPWLLPCNRCQSPTAVSHLQVIHPSNQRHRPHQLPTPAAMAGLQ
jgi:hypothetical protein